jgi:regulator of protease activity HflC (stomatin/prohibitin superfamily)
MSSLQEGAAKSSDDSVAVLGRDGGSANVNATVLYRLDPKKADDVYRTLGVNYQSQIVRPSARNCIRIIFTHYDVVTAATSAWDAVETAVSKCMKDKIVPRGLLLQDFQLREVTLAASIRTAVNDKVKQQQLLEQKRFELATALQQADIARFQALATADSQQIVACGGRVQKVLRDGRQISTVVPNPLTECNQTQLTPAYLQFTYIQALAQLAQSKTNTTLVLPFDQNLTPLLNLNTGGGSTTVTPPTSGG